MYLKSEMLNLAPYYLVLIQSILSAKACVGGDGRTVRLSGFNSSYVGYVQVCKDRQWLPVYFEAEEDWTQKNSFVACKELGFHGAVRIFPSTPVISTLTSDASRESSSQPPSKHHYVSLECTGLETSLRECNWTVVDEPRNNLAMVLCQRDPYEGQLNVVGMSGADTEGLLTVYGPLAAPHWSTLCTTDWDDADAEVACRQMGYQGGLSRRYSDYFTSYGLPHPSNVHYQCAGSESKLADCKQFTAACRASDHAALVCTTEAKDGSTPDMTVIILVSMITITLVLITILLVVLKCVVKRFKKKPLVTPERRAVSRRCSRQPRIVHTQLDLHMPYAIEAPPSYRDTVLADMRIQSSAGVVAGEDEESSLLTSQDVLAQEDEDTTAPPQSPQPV